MKVPIAPLNPADPRQTIERIDEQIVKLLAERQRSFEALIDARERERSFSPASSRGDQIISNAKLLAYANRADPALVESLWTVMLKWFVLYEDRLVAQRRPG
ncbi:MAG: chorismate mutase [Alphaproteobacteria bacterium]|nr:chorismate mutase [Alphaproteobacteria bacterium]